MDTKFKDKIDLVSRLLRDLEIEIGTRDVANLFFEALKTSIINFKPKEVSEFCKQFEDIKYIISQTEPKFGILNYHIANLSKYLTVCSVDKSAKVNEEWRNSVVELIDKILNEAKKQKEKLMHNACKVEVDGKTILIHDHSHTVQDVLAYYKKQGNHFRVIIAEQDYEKTHSNIEKMHAVGIPFQVVPAYMLSHIHETVDLVFFGGLTLKDTMHFVMDPGAYGVVSEFHSVGRPIYMFMDTSKFSLWKSKKRGEIFMHKHLRIDQSKQIEYERIKYSHDRVPAELFTKIITNEGVFSPEELKVVFEKKMEEFNLDGAGGQD